MTEQVIHMIEDLVPITESDAIIRSVEQAMDGDYIHPEKYICHLTTILRIVANVHHLAFQYQTQLNILTEQNLAIQQNTTIREHNNATSNSLPDNQCENRDIRSMDSGEPTTMRDLRASNPDAGGQLPLHTSQFPCASQLLGGDQCSEPQCGIGPRREHD